MKAQGGYYGGELLVPSVYSTIQAAIDAAVDGDIVWVADGTYTGSGNKDIDFGGKQIVLQSENGPENCIIDCEGDGRGFYFHNGEDKTSVVSGFTITNGRVDSYGGGIYCDESSPTITRCIISGNTATHDGGGICSYISSSIITNCTISDNTTAYDGGGIFYYDTSPGNSDSTITGCTISENTAYYGGGICCYCSPTIANTIIWNNTSDAIFLKDDDSSPMVTYSDIQGGWEGEGNMDADPLFVSDGDYHLTAGSPCIDAGSNDVADLPDTDMDGDPRISGACVDMGADEYSNAGTIDFGELDATLVLMHSMQYTVPSGSVCIVYGHSGSDYLTIESGAAVKISNFSGNNTLYIESDTSVFTVFRSGSTVTFEGSDGTFLIIPATTSVQTIVFSDRTLELQIASDQVWLDNQVIQEDAAPIE